MRVEIINGGYDIALFYKSCNVNIILNKRKRSKSINKFAASLKIMYSICNIGEIHAEFLAYIRMMFFQ